MGEKERAPYAWKQRPGPCWVYSSPERVRETPAPSETRGKTAQSPRCSLRMTEIIVSGSSFLYSSASGREWAWGFSEHRESCPGVQKEIYGLAPTVINTRGSSGVIRSGACVETPRHLQSWLFWEPDHWGLCLWGRCLLQRGPLLIWWGAGRGLDSWGQLCLRCCSFPQW